MELLRVVIGFVLFILLVVSILKSYEFYNKKSFLENLMKGDSGAHLLPFLHKEKKGRFWASVFWIVCLVFFIFAVIIWLNGGVIIVR